MPAADREERSPHRPVPMRDLLASCAAARAVSTPPWHPHPPLTSATESATATGDAPAHGRAEWAE